MRQSLRSRVSFLQISAFSFGLLLLNAGCARPAGNTASLALQGRSVRLAIDAALNGGASIAAFGSRVAVAWSATQGDRTNIYAAISEDGGATFGAPVRVNDTDGDARVTGEQPPRVAIGRDVTVVWESKAAGQSRVRLAKSEDGGHTFLPAITIHADLGGARGWASLAIDPANVTHIAWLDGRNAHAEHQAASAKPSGGGSHAMHGSTRQDIFHAIFPSDGAVGGSAVAANVCFCCKTGVAVGPDGATYVAWRHIYPTNLRDIAVARSAANGQPFGEPVRVSEDHWQIEGCPEDGPAIAVDAQNQVHVVWPTLLKGSDGGADESESRKAIFYSASGDHGQSFVPRIRIDQGSAANAIAAHPQVAVAGSRAIVVWEESTGADHRVRARVLASQNSAPQLGPILAIGGEFPDSYPSIAATAEAVVVAWTAKTPNGPEIRVQKLN